MKEKIISAILYAEAPGLGKPPIDSAKYYVPFEELYESDREAFAAALMDIRGGESDMVLLLHALRLSAYFGVQTETWAREMREIYRRFDDYLEKSRDVYKRRNSALVSFRLDELFESVSEGKFLYKGEGERPDLKEFIDISEVRDIRSAGLYYMCAEFCFVPPCPKFIKNALRASIVVDRLYGTVPWKYYLCYTSAKQIAKDIAALETVGFVKIPQMLAEFLEKFTSEGISSRNDKIKFFEKLCTRNKAETSKIMKEEENIIDEYIIFHNNC